MFTSLSQQSTLPEIVQVLDRLPTDLVLKMKGDLTPDVLYPVHRELRVVVGHRFDGITPRLILLREIEEEGIRRYLNCFVPGHLMCVFHYPLHYIYTHVIVSCDIDNTLCEMETDFDHHFIVNDRIQFSFTMNLARLEEETMLELVFQAKQRLDRYLRMDAYYVSYTMDTLSQINDRIEISFTATLMA